MQGPGFDTQHLKKNLTAVSLTPSCAFAIASYCSWILVLFGTFHLQIISLRDLGAVAGSRSSVKPELGGGQSNSELCLPEAADETCCRVP